MLANGSLVIDEVHLSDQGKYGCTAGNSGGLKRFEVMLLVRSKFSFFIKNSADNNIFSFNNCNDSTYHFSALTEL